MLNLHAYAEHRYLVTGDLGFIGARLARALIAADGRVLLLTG